MLMGTRGRPKVSEFVEHCIAHKVIQYRKRFNETSYKAWFRLVKHRAFKDLMKEIQRLKTIKRPKMLSQTNTTMRNWNL